MPDDTGLPGHAPLTPLSGETVLVDRARDRPVLRLAGTVVLPLGATVDLPASAQSAVVVGVRLRSGAPGGNADAMTLWLEVDVPPASWDERERSAGQAVPAPLAAATAELDPNPDAGTPLGIPLS